MSAIYLLIPLSLLVALGFLAAFIWAVRAGQYEDTETPPLRMLADESPKSSVTKFSQPSKLPPTHERRDL